VWIPTLPSLHMSIVSPFVNVRIVFCVTVLIRLKLVTDGGGMTGTGAGTGARTGGLTGAGHPTTSKQTVNVFPTVPLPSIEVNGFAEIHWWPYLRSVHPR
jgi:hypothetical protein